MLSDHDCFDRYLHHISNAENSAYSYCSSGLHDDPLHTHEWNETSRKRKDQLGKFGSENTTK